MRSMDFMNYGLSAKCGIKGSQVRDSSEPILCPLLFGLILYVPGNNSQSCRDGSSLVEPFLSRGFKDTTQPLWWSSNPQPLDSTCTTESPPSSVLCPWAKYMLLIHGNTRSGPLNTYTCTSLHLYLILPMLSYPGCHANVVHWLYWNSRIWSSSDAIVC